MHLCQSTQDAAYVVYWYAIHQLWSSVPLQSYMQRNMELFVGKYLFHLSPINTPIYFEQAVQKQWF